MTELQRKYYRLYALVLIEATSRAYVRDRFHRRFPLTYRRLLP